MKIEKETAVSISILLVVVCIILFVFISGKKILEFFNIIDTKDEKRQKETIEKTKGAPAAKDYFSPNYATNIPRGYTGAYLLTEKAGKGLSMKLWSCRGRSTDLLLGKIPDDDENGIYAVFNLLNYKTQVSDLCRFFFAMYNKNLFDWLGEFLNNEEMTRIIQICDKKPAGFKK